MKKILSRIAWLISRPLFDIVIGLLLMIIPSVYAASMGYVSFEPGFTFGVFFGAGMMFSLDGLISILSKDK